MILGCDKAISLYINRLWRVFSFLDNNNPQLLFFTKVSINYYEYFKTYEYSKAAMPDFIYIITVYIMCESGCKMIGSNNNCILFFIFYYMNLHFTIYYIILFLCAYRMTMLVYVIYSYKCFEIP